MTSLVLTNRQCVASQSTDNVKKGKKSVTKFERLEVSNKDFIDKKKHENGGTHPQMTYQPKSVEEMEDLKL